jgi:hypothetical protein
MGGLVRQAIEGRDDSLLQLAAVLIFSLALSGILVLSGHGPVLQTAAPSALPAASDSLDAYRGLATWVSIYDARAWANPEAAVADMSGHGVQTLFIQTGNSNSKGVVYNPASQEAFIRAAHARGMKIVAWYLPEMADMAHDYDRIAQAIGVRTSDGQTFDSFALDIESTKIKSIASRNTAVRVLAAKVRALVGESYVMGAIVPSPVGIAKRTGFWNDFPYGAVAADFQVLLPMGYYTYHGKGAAAAAADVTESVRMIRATPGCEEIPIHFIGGLAASTTPAEVGAFAAATTASGCVGGSLYSWSGTTAAEWDALHGLAR